MMSLWDALRMNMMISYQELVRTFLNHYQAEIELYPDKIALSFLFLSGFSPYRNNFNG